MTRDARGRFVSAKPCEITREIGGYWCRTHRKWADDGHVRAAAYTRDTEEEKPDERS